MKTWSISIGEVFGVQLRLHATFLLLLLFVWLTQSALPGGSISRGLALVGLVLAAVLLHEVGHMLAAVHENLTPRVILLLPLGGIPLYEERERAAAEPGREVRIALAGPMVNLLVAAVAATVVIAIAPELGLTKQPLIHSAALLRSFVWVNVSLAFVNLLPAYPLDGGRIVRAVFARTGDPYMATRKAVTIGQAFSMAFILLGIWNTWAMLAGFFLFVATQLEDRSTVFHSVMQHVLMEDVMLTDFSTLSPADTLEDAFSKAVHSLQDDFPVVRGTEMVGVVTRQSILQALRHGGNGYVQSVMNRVFPVATRKESLASAFGKIDGQGSTLIPVVDDQRLVGIVTMQNLMHSMRLLAEGRKLR